MRMSTAVVNGNEADSHGHKQNHSDVVSSQFESTKMKNVSHSGPDFDKSISSRVNENEGVNQEELSSMKDLMLIHLDLIQQQAEQLSKKDKNIEDLTNENELLKQRLTRMERRVSLQKTKGDKKQQPHSSQDNIEGGRKRRHTEIGPPPTQTQFLRPGRKSVPETSSSKRLRRDKTDGRKSRHRKADENENEPAINLDDKLTTNVAYYTAVGDDQRWAPDHFKAPRSRVLLEVPKWRELRYTPTYTMEGTENLSDDVFERRHYKLMIDEKKRKRWDIQRIREQRAAEKLRSREGNADKNNEKAKLKTLWPQPSEGLRLAVTPLVPVSVFGINLPAITTHDFTLPWREGTKNRKKSKR